MKKIDGESLNTGTMLTRRSLAKGTAWAMPTLAVGTMAPAFAVSCPNGSTVVSPSDGSQFAPNLLQLSAEPALPTGEPSYLVNHPLKKGEHVADLYLDLTIHDPASAYPVATKGETQQIAYLAYLSYDYTARVSGCFEPDPQVASLFEGFLNVAVTSLDGVEPPASLQRSPQNWDVGALIALTYSRDVSLSDLSAFPGFADGAIHVRIGSLVACEDQPPLEWWDTPSAVWASEFTVPGQAPASGMPCVSYSYAGASYVADSTGCRSDQNPAMPCGFQGPPPEMMFPPDSPLP